MRPAPVIRVNPEAAYTRQPIGEASYCLLYDEFLLDPQRLISWAREHRNDFFEPERPYPGVVLPLGEDEAAPLFAFARERLSREFGFLREEIDLQAQLSITTLQPEQFAWFQRLPHSDDSPDTEHVNIALLLYLFRDPSLGGTGFYRWRDPAFRAEVRERQAEDPEADFDDLQARYRLFRDPAAYTTDSNEAVELIAHVPAKFNRLIVYAGDVPHNAFVRDPGRLSRDPGHGRLTLNCFALARRPPASGLPIG